MPDTNPLLQHWDLPPWSAARAEHLVPAINTIIADNRRIIAEVIVSQARYPNWDDLVLAVDETDARLHEAMGIIDTLSTVNLDEDWVRETRLCANTVAQYVSEKATNRPLFDAYQRLATSPIAGSFDPARQASLAKILRKYRLAGVQLLPEQQQKLLRLNRDIRRLEQLFLIHLESANAAWSKRIDDASLLDGLAADVLARLASNATQAGHDGWRLALDQNTYEQIMTHAKNRALREEYFLAYSTRASDTGPHADLFDNHPVLTLLLKLRQQQALLLGFENFAQLRLETGVSAAITQVSDFLRRQVELITPALHRDMLALQVFAREQGLNDIRAWDYDFLAEQLRRQQLNGALKGLRQYFPLDGTLQRLCRFSEHMFAIKIVELTSFSRWHDQVRLFAVSEHEQTIGYFYLDPFQRPGAPDFASTDTLRNRRINAEGRPTLPIAILSCNFPGPTADHPCLLSHEHLRVLIHELGHCLQQVLTRSPHHNLSGISQLRRESAEFAGQLFEHWCLSKDFLRWLAAHHQSGERLSEARVDTVLIAIEAHTSRATAMLLMGALFDLELHRTQGDGRDISEVFEDVQREIPHMHLAEHQRFANGFDYLVTGYEASVYAYKWSGVLASEAFQRFHQEGVFNPQTGQAFREAFFSPGDSRPLLSALEAFLERPVDPRLFTDAQD